MENMIMKRLSVDKYYLNIAKAVAARSTCLIRQYGAVIVNNDEIISTGYNGSPRGTPNCCDEGFCKRHSSNHSHNDGDYDFCESVHAEMNAMLSAARSEMIGATLYLYGEENKEDRMSKEIKEETTKKAERYEEERFNADRALTDLAKDLLSIAGKVEKRMDDLMKDYFPEDVSISMKTQTYRLIGQIRMGHAGEVVINDNPMVRKLSYLIDPNHSLPVISAVIDRENCPGGKYVSTYDSVCKTAAQQHTDEGKVGSSDIIEVLDYINDHQTLIECAIKNKDRFLQEYLNEHPGLTMEEEDRNDE